jgi:Fe2+ or Zn2+ uptake regulation protein
MTNPNNDTKEANPPTLQKLLKDSSMAKLLDFLTLYQNYDYSKTEISNHSGVSWKTLYRIFPTLEQYNIVTKTRQVGRATLYKLNQNSPIAQALNKLANEIAIFDAQKIAQQEQQKTQTQKIPA